MDSLLRQKVINSNRLYHAELAKDYDKTQPHYLPENQERVETIISDLAAKSGGESLLDLGCGTGFVLNIAHKYFKRVVGVDLTEEMLDLVDTSSGKVELINADTGCLDMIKNETFSACTAYSYLHHLYDMMPTLREAYRCLNPGGFFYSDADPNRYFWELFKSNDFSTAGGVVEREYHAVINVAEEISQSSKMSAEDVALAEYQKEIMGGIDPEEIEHELENIGFSSIKYRYEWYLGQGKVIHQQPEVEAEVIETYLRDCLPTTRSLFKYFSIYAQK